MKIVFHLAHPAHFHLFKEAIQDLQKRHEVMITYNEKDVLENLLASSSLKQYSVKIKATTNTSSKLGLMTQFLSKNLGYYKTVKNFRPDLMLGTSIIISLMGKLLGRPSVIVNEDDFDVVAKTANVGYPFANYILCPHVVRTTRFDTKSVKYKGYHELAYLSPKYFHPDRKLIEPLFDGQEKYFILRFAKLTAHHDEGKTGMTPELTERIISLLKPRGKIYITSERELEPQFEPYRISIDPMDMHHAMYFASMYIGDSQTMAAEAAVLGTPSIRFNDFVGKLSYLDELEFQHHLTFGIPTSEPERLVSQVKELLNIPDIREIWAKRRQEMLAEKIDVTAFMIWFIENYPKSAQQMLADSHTQKQFMEQPATFQIAS
ncbi:MAG: DUF354 domain-containing protein [Bacteroidia bacterium]